MTTRWLFLLLAALLLARKVLIGCTPIEDYPDYNIYEGYTSSLCDATSPKSM